MTKTRLGSALLTVVLIANGMISFQPTMASDELPRSLRIPLASRERIPISTILSHPDDYHLREVRLAGTVTKDQTEIITDWRTCGQAYERTTFTVEDDSGAIDIIDQGACGRNMSVLKAPMVKVWQQVDLLVLVMLVTNTGRSESSLEPTLRFLDIPRY